MVGATGFELVTTRTPSVCATRLRYGPTKVTEELGRGHIFIEQRTASSVYSTLNAAR